ncbi:class III RPD3 type histone deacetylase [Micractinium conductrix]|uniref:Class III RPD3 type histone deacetylase n=1 Tax=Micractinium conductrix TaxID=554055 RepID=A0A2P6VAN6_9CHLO|nr:class III RPD3 type histone deacetylase [Micractinium conductrix]|eukprot:PSC71162.1 class III RPD3 type histone deacetylase [Micractinium conductrix]
MGARHSSSAAGAAAADAPAGALDERRRSSFAACARPDIATTIRDKYGDLGGWPAADKLPVVYNEAYNIGFWGLEKLHPFDSKKFRRVLALLEAGGVLRRQQLVQASEASQAVLQEVHTPRYLAKLNSSSFTVAQVTELAPLVFLPPFLLRKKVLQPMATMAGGSMLAAALAMERGWAINLGGGMHHAAPDAGGGWCPYADIHLALRRLRVASGGAATRFLYVDLDVHQGNGVERCKLHFGEAEQVYIVDVYNGRAYPWDTEAKRAINQRVELEPGTGDDQYLGALAGALARAFEEFPNPDLLIYNAGTDILQGDPLGRLGVSPGGVVQRDRLVWATAVAHRTPILQLLSGGYTPASTPVIARCIETLFNEFGLGADVGTG